MCEAYVYVFGQSIVSSWPVLVCQFEFFNFLVLLVVVGRDGWPCYFVLLFAFFDSVLTLEAQLSLHSFCDCIGFVSKLRMGFHRVFCSLYGFPLGICVDFISQLMGGMPCF